MKDKIITALLLVVIFGLPALGEVIRQGGLW